MAKSRHSPPNANRPVISATRKELDRKELLEALHLCEEVLSHYARLDDGTPSVSAIHGVRDLIERLEQQEGADVHDS
jgi:hypothetical protein